MGKKEAAGSTMKREGSVRSWETVGEGDKEEGGCRKQYEARR